MAPKRKVELTAIDESDAALYPVFRNAANDLSQLYNQALSLQKTVFEAGQRHALETLNEWMARKLQEGIMITVGDIYAYLQNELNETPPVSQPQQPCSGRSHQSGASQSGQVEVNLSSSSSMQTRNADGKAFDSHDMEMVMNMDDPIH